MPEVGLTTPLWLLALPLALLPVLSKGSKRCPYPALCWLPEDKLSRTIDRSRRWLAWLFLTCLILALADPYLKEQKVARLGTGAHIVLTIDRSSSMNEDFSGYLSGKAKNSKSAAARKLLLQFIEHRRQDLFAMVAFSTAPIHILPLTQDREAIRAAVEAIDLRGRGVTNIAPGLLMALEEFRNHPVTGARVILLVSDGGTHIDEDTQDRIRQRFRDVGARLYWIYLRNPRSISVLHPPKRNLSETTTPEYFLHQYFQTLGVPYQVFEADDPESLAAAIATVDRLENRPLRYFETIPRRDLAAYFYGLTLLFGLPLLLWNALEIRQWFEPTE
ncbi:MAG TPA: VWA domain-containing protein [Methylothermaceae bacterium]|nr:VWA domain-containing protein [Methylothermaceae bacterium]